jgi:hypothetical protein
MIISHKVKFNLFCFTFVRDAFQYNANVIKHYIWMCIYLFIFLIFSDYILTDLDLSAHCVIQYSNEDDILVMIDDIYIKQRYLVCLLDGNKWLDDEVSTLITNKKIVSDYSYTLVMYFYNFNIFR